MKAPDSRVGRQNTGKIPLSAFCLFAILAFILTACAKKPEEAPPEIIRPVKTATVAAGSEITGMTLPGTVRASQTIF